ncbi:MAG: NUDIX domain-containing protein [Candidatus Bathyarchaeota archaeon]|nr:NUDIX domain-containing protein [Candidatus Bathyarchaeota archaeon]
MDASKIIDKLAEIFTPTSISDADAAVCLLLKTVDKNLSVLLVKRVENPIDPWSGQTGLPGGKRSQLDLSLKQTVVREVLEEINVNLSNQGRFLGVLPVSTSMRGPKLKVRPFIFSIDYEPLVSLNSELQEFFWIQVDALAQHREVVNLGFGDLSAFVYGDNIIWGLTYRILETFLNALKLLH